MLFFSFSCLFVFSCSLVVFVLVFCIDAVVAVYNIRFHFEQKIVLRLCLHVEKSFFITKIKNIRKWGPPNVYWLRELSRACQDGAFFLTIYFHEMASGYFHLNLFESEIKTTQKECHKKRKGFPKR